MGRTSAGSECLGSGGVALSVEIPPELVEGRRPEPRLPRLALSIKEAAEALSVSESHFKRHVLPNIRVTMSGGRRLVMVRELERYLTERAV
jgi:hypothetical protein